MGNEWSLVFFTVISQAGIGLMTANQLFNRQRLALNKILFCILSLTVISMGVSLTHLGSPFNSYAAIFNLANSWLSRENLFLGLFLALTSLVFFFNIRSEKGSPPVIGWLAVAAGLLCLISMANVYTNTAFAAWETFYTHLLFYTTAAALGSLVYAVLVWQPAKQKQDTAVSQSLVLGIAAIILQIISLLAYVIVLSNGSAAMQQSLALLAAQLPLLISSQIIAFLAIVGIVFCLHRYQQERIDNTNTLLNMSLFAIVITAVILRYLFYSCGVLPMGI